MKMGSFVLVMFSVLLLTFYDELPAVGGNNDSESIIIYYRGNAIPLVPGSQEIDGRVLTSTASRVSTVNKKGEKITFRKDESGMFQLMNLLFPKSRNHVYFRVAKTWPRAMVFIDDKIIHSALTGREGSVYFSDQLIMGLHEVSVQKGDNLVSDKVYVSKVDREFRCVGKRSFNCNAVSP